MTYCASCRFADDHGIIGNVTTCTFDALQRWMGDSCERWELETREFAEMYPEYAHVSTDTTGRHLGMLVQKAIQGDGALDPVQPGLVRITHGESKQLTLLEGM